MSTGLIFRLLNSGEDSGKDAAESGLIRALARKPGDRCEPSTTTPFACKGGRYGSLVSSVFLGNSGLSPIHALNRVRVRASRQSYRSSLCSRCRSAGIDFPIWRGYSRSGSNHVRRRCRRLRWGIGKIAVGGSSPRLRAGEDGCRSAFFRGGALHGHSFVATCRCARDGHGYRNSHAGSRAGNGK